MTTLSERDQHGRFEPGNSGGPGRPKRAVEKEYLAVISETCSVEEWRAIVELAVKQAKNGQEKAREWLASYLVGKPAAIAPTLNGLAVAELAGADEVELEAMERQGALHLRRLLAEAGLH